MSTHTRAHRENMSLKCIPLKPHFYREKLGYAGVYLIFSFLIQNTHYGCLLERPRHGGSNVYPMYVWSENNQSISNEILFFSPEKISPWASFRNVTYISCIILFTNLQTMQIIIDNRLSPVYICKEAMASC